MNASDVNIAMGEEDLPQTPEENPSKHIEFLHEIGSRIADADPLHVVLDRIVAFVSSLVRCDSCLVYVLEGDKLVLQASVNPHADLVGHLDLPLGQGITGWVGQHKRPVAIASGAANDPRFKLFNELPEDRFEAFLSVPIVCRGRLVGVINVQHRQAHHHTRQEVELIATLGFLVGAEIELARLENERSDLAEQLETRKMIERAKGILQRDLNLSEEAAYLALRNQSRQKRMSMRQIAEAIILMQELKRLHGS